MRVRVLLMSAAALALMGASAGDMAWARPGGHGGGPGGHGGMGGRGGGAPSFSAGVGSRGTMGAAPSFHGQTTGAAPNVRANTFSGNRPGNFVNRGNFANRGNFVNHGNAFVNRGNAFASRGNWRNRGLHDHDRFRRFGGGVFFGGYPYGYDDDYSYNNCNYGNYDGWGTSSYYCGPYAYGYDGGDYYGEW